MATEMNNGDVLLDVKDLNISFKTKKGRVKSVEHLNFQMKNFPAERSNSVL